jgi:hypothetical protein
MSIDWHIEEGAAGKGELRATFDPYETASWLLALVVCLLFWGTVFGLAIWLFGG